MKNLKITLCLTLLLASSALNGKAFTDSVWVNIKITDTSFNHKTPKLYLQKLGDKVRTSISPNRIKDGQFVFTFKNENYFECIVRFDPDNTSFVPFYLSPESSHVEVEYFFPSTNKMAFINRSRGSKAQADIKRIEDRTNEILHQNDEKLRLKYQDYNKIASRADIRNERYNLNLKDRFEFIKKLSYDTTVYAPVLYLNIINSFDDWSIDQLKAFLFHQNPREAVSIYEEIKGNIAIKEAAFKDEKLKATLLKNAEIQLAIKTINQKYVYLSFWASWCGPCRSHNKTLKSANYKNLGFIGISFDKNLVDMIRAGKEDDIDKWKQVQIKEGFESEIAKSFGINALPGNILLNDKREIIGINVSDQTLEYLIFQK
ncbi:thiol-disulfide isomerase/thioredoxin [Flavobacterium sp. W4I14]|nr:thiol-disulfide isomerase/thioredoxin [Flavobacterium sp. W4I14]